jgi:hypothetical protein
MRFQTSIEPAEFWDQALRLPDGARYGYESRPANSRRRGSRRKSITVGVLPSVQNTVLPPPPRTGAVDVTSAVLMAVLVLVAVPGGTPVRVTYTGICPAEL